MVNENKENSEKNIEKLEIESKDISEVTSEQPIPQAPIPVVVVSEKGEKIKDEIGELQEKFLGNLKEGFNIQEKFLNYLKDHFDYEALPQKLTKWMKFWLWFQRHKFILLVGFLIGISSGIGIDKYMNKIDTRKSINLGIFEFEGYLFEVQHSARKKFFEDNKINIPEKPQQENEATKGK